MDFRHTAEELKQMQSLPLEAKIVKSRQRIREWYDHYDGNVYISFSGGKDSTVLLDLVRSEYPNVPAVYIDTGLEFPEIKAFVRTVENVTILRPAKSFRQVVEECGYPVPSKAKKLPESWSITRKGKKQEKAASGAASTWSAELISQTASCRGSACLSVGNAC